MNHFNLVLKVVIALRTLLNVLDSLRQAIDRSQESVLILLDIASILQILLFSLKTLQCKNVKFTILLVYLIQLQTDVDPIFLTIPSSFSLVAFTLTSSLFGIEILKAQGFGPFSFRIYFQPLGLLFKISFRLYADDAQIYVYQLFLSFFC